MSWKTLRLGEIAIEDRRIIPPDSAEATSRPYLGLEQIESGTGRILSYDGNSAEGKSTTFAFDESHVLYGKLRPYLNKVVIPNRKGRCSTEIIPLLPQHTELEFLSLLLRTDTVVNAAMSGKTGSRMPRADMSTLFKLKVAIPETLAEQRHIATHLKAQLAEVETARQAAQAQVRDADLLAHTVRRAVFASVLKSHGRTAKMKDVCTLSAGGTPHRGNHAFFEGTIPWVKTLDLNFGTVISTEEKISPQAFQNIRGALLPKGTVLVAMYGGAGTIGKSGILGIEACTNQAVCALQPQVSILDSTFLHEWLRYMRPEWMQHSGGNRKDPNINKSIVENMTLPLPALVNQQKCVTRLKSQLAEVDAIRAAAATQLAEIERLPQRLLAKAFEAPHQET